MDAKRTWVAIGAVAVLGVGGTATAALALDDRAPLPAGSAVDLGPAQDRETTDGAGTAGAGTDGAGADGTVDASPESADSPNASAADSAGSAADAPDRSDDSPADRDTAVDASADDARDDTAGSPR